METSDSNLQALPNQGLFKSLLVKLDAVAAKGTKICTYAAGGCVLLLFVLIFINVFARYLFNHPFKFADEIVRYINAWMVYFSLVCAFRFGRHIAIVVVTSHFRPAVRDKLETVGRILTFLWVTLLTHGAWVLWLDLLINQTRSYGLLEVLLWLPGLCIILGMSWFFFEMLVDLLSILFGVKKPELQAQGH